MACVLWSGRVWAVSVEAAHIIYLSRAEQHEEEISLLRFRGGRNGHCLIHRRAS